MSLIVHVTVPVAGRAQVIPPDGREHDGVWHWKVINPTGGAVVELIDDPTKALGQGEPLAVGATWESDGRDVKLWALGPATGSAPTVIVEGENKGD